MLHPNKITTAQIQIFRQNWNDFFSNISHQLQLTPIVSRAKNKWYKPKKVKKLALNLQLLTVQILTNDVHVLILCLSYFITTVPQNMLPESFFSRNLIIFNLIISSKLKPKQMRWQYRKCQNYLLLSKCGVVEQNTSPKSVNLVI